MSLDQARENRDLTPLQQEILDRAQSAKSVKVLNQAEQIIKAIQRGYTEGDLQEMQNDFFVLVNDPDAPEGGGTYKGWTPEEIKEYYFVLYGEKMNGDEE